MTDLRYRIVDVFSERPLAGNALCVVLDACPQHLMPALARETNLSETTFVVARFAHEYEMRIFTPLEELPFAGHPTLGTAWVLGPNTWTQTTAGATVEVVADEHGAVMGQPDPVFDEADGTEAARLLGLAADRAVAAVVATAGGMQHMIVATEAPIDVLVPDIAALPPGRTHAVVRPVGDAVLEVRVFVAGIGEDPGTGSAAGPIATLARRLWSTAEDVTIEQGDYAGRPCRIQVHAEAGAIRVGGRVSACAEGRFTL